MNRFSENLLIERIYSVMNRKSLRIVLNIDEIYGFHFYPSNIYEDKMYL